MKMLSLFTILYKLCIHILKYKENRKFQEWSLECSQNKLAFRAPALHKNSLVRKSLQKVQDNEHLTPLPLLCRDIKGRDIFEKFEPIPLW